MQLLLDTHTFLWWLAGDYALSAKARSAIANEDNGIFISAAAARGRCEYPLVGRPIPRVRSARRLQVGSNVSLRKDKPIWHKL